MAKPDAIEELKIGDPFQFFFQQAHRFRKEAALPIEFLHEAVAIVKGAFGDAWLREQVEARQPGAAFPLHVHPLGGMFCVPGPQSIGAVFELAVYLKRLAQAPGLPQVIQSMKENWAPGLMQLAHGYRFQRAGATDLEFEPDASDGRKADIAFCIDAVPCLVECYIPRIRYADTSKELQYSMDKIREAAGVQPFRVSIHLRRPIDASDRKRIERQIVNALLNRTSGRIELHDDAANILIENVTSADVESDFSGFREGKLPGAADWVGCCAWWSVGGLQTFSIERTSRGSRFVAF